MGNTRAGNTLSATSTWGANSAQRVGSTLRVEGGIGVRQGKRFTGECRQLVAHFLQPGMNQEVDRLPQPSATQEAEELPSPVQLERWVIFEDTSLDLGPETPLKVADQSCPVEDHPPSPPSNLNGTTETLDLTQPMEGDDHASLSSNSDETVDWSQSAGGDLGDPPVLDPHMCKFLLEVEASCSRGNEQQITG